MGGGQISRKKVLRNIWMAPMLPSRTISETSFAIAILPRRCSRCLVARLVRHKLSKISKWKQNRVLPSQVKTIILLTRFAIVSMRFWSSDQTNLQKIYRQSYISRIFVILRHAVTLPSAIDTFLFVAQYWKTFCLARQTVFAICLLEMLPRAPNIDFLL